MTNKIPKSICLLRLSAIGDIVHTLPVFNTLRQVWPDTKITWIIGKVEYELVKDIAGVEFIIFDKKAGLTAYKNLHHQLKNKKFDVLLHMQMSFRSSIINLLIKSKIKVGFDRKRAKDGQWLFTNKKIKYIPKQHVMDSLFGFIEAIGIIDKKYVWDIPIPEHTQSSAEKLLGEISNYIIISPCSSKDYRNWNIQGYSAIADYISEKYHCSVVLTGGNSKIENDYADSISENCKSKPINLIGKTNLKQLLAIINGAKAVISPDSGPAHIATAVTTPVIGLYATTNPDRARPYLSSDWVINRYTDAINKKYNTSVENMPWGTRVRDLWAMDLISVEDVKAKIDQLFK